MAAVDPAPQYIHQAWKVIARALAVDEPLLDDWFARWVTHKKPAFNVDARTLMLARCGLLDPPDEAYDDDYWAGLGSVWLGVAAGTRADFNLQERVAHDRAVARWYRALTAAWPDLTVLTDETARCAAVHAALSLKWETNPLPARYARARTIAADIMRLQVAGSKLTYGRAMPKWHEIRSLISCAEEELRASVLWEDIMLRSPGKYASVKNYATAPIGDPLEVFAPPANCPTSTVSSIRVWRVSGLWAVLDVKEQKLLLLDRAGIDQVRIRARRAALWKYSVANYRRCNGRYSADHKAEEVYRIVRSFHITALERAAAGQVPPWAIAKAVKGIMAGVIAGYRLAGEVPAIAEQMRVKADAMYAAADAEYPGVWNMWARIAELEAEVDVVIDQLYFFHIVPSSDADPWELFSKTVQEMRAAHRADPEAKKAFLAYTRSWILSHAVARSRRNADYISCVPGYDVTERDWFKQCMEGQHCMPPPAEHGKAWLDGAFPYQETMALWWLSAGDKTHVSSHPLDWPQPEGDKRERHIMSNELLYVLKYGAMLSKQWTAEQVRAETLSSSKSFVTVADITSKSENTKGGRKTREIFAAGSCTREAQSEWDHGTCTMSAIVPGPTLRKGTANLTRKARAMAAKLTGHGMAIATSQDVSSWSPHMDRDLLFDFADIVQTAWEDHATIPTMRAIWDGMTFRINRQGAVKREAVETGAIMGFTGGLDTLLHSAIISYLVYGAKQAGLLTEDEIAEPMTQIDDAFVVFELSEHVDFAEARIARLNEKLVSVYASLGFEIDTVKTLVSCTRATFLNRVYCNTIEALTPTKIASRIDRELRLLYSSALDQVETLANTAYAAAERGACPMTCYKLYVEEGVAALLTSAREVKQLSTFRTGLIAMTPTDFGGWGIKSMVAWAGSGRPDALAAWLADMCELQKVLTPACREYHLVGAHVAQVLRQPFELTNYPALRTIANPMAVRIHGVTSPGAMVTQTLVESAKRFTTDPTISSYLRAQESPELEAALHALLTTSTLSAALVSALYAALPGNILTAIISKAEKNEVVGFLLTWRERDRLRKNMRAADIRAVNHIARLGPLREHGEIDMISGYATAAAVRADYQAALGYTITACTAPAASELLCQTTKESASITLVNRGLAAPPGCSHADFYWGRAKGTAVYGLMSRPLRWDQIPVLRETPPGVRDLVKALAIASFELPGDRCKPIFTFLSMCYTGAPGAFDNMPLPTISATTTKRLLRDSYVRHQPIGFAPNVQGAVEVQWERFIAYLQSRHSRHNPLAILQEIRLVGLLDLMLGEEWTTRYYGISLEHFAGWDDPPSDIPPTGALEELLALLPEPPRLSKPVVDAAVRVMAMLEDGVELAVEEADELPAEAKPGKARTYLPIKEFKLAKLPGARSDVVVGPLEFEALPADRKRKFEDAKDSVNERVTLSVARMIGSLQHSETSRINAVLTAMHTHVSRTLNNVIPLQTTTETSPMEMSALLVSALLHGEERLTQAWGVVKNIYRVHVARDLQDVFRAWLSRDMATEEFPTAVLLAAIRDSDVNHVAGKYVIGKMMLRNAGVIKYRSDYLLEMRAQDPAVTLAGWRDSWLRGQPGNDTSIAIISEALAADPDMRTGRAAADALARATRAFLQRHGLPTSCILDWPTTTKKAATTAIMGGNLLGHISNILWVKDMAYLFIALIDYAPLPSAPGGPIVPIPVAQPAEEEVLGSWDAYDLTLQTDAGPAEFCSELEAAVHFAYYNSVFPYPTTVAEANAMAAANNWRLQDVMRDYEDATDAKQLYLRLIVGRKTQRDTK